MNFQLEIKEMERERDFYPCSCEPQTGLFLYALMHLHQPAQALELGTYKGYSSLYMAAAASEIVGCQFTTVDRVDQRSLRLTQGGPSLFHRFVKATSFDYLRDLSTTVDFCFLDTSHTYRETKAELELLWPKLAPGGLLVMHDPLSFPDIPRAVKDVIADSQPFDLPTPKIPGRDVALSGLLLLRKPSLAGAGWDASSPPVPVQAATVVVPPSPTQ